MKQLSYRKSRHIEEEEKGSIFGSNLSARSAWTKELDPPAMIGSFLRETMSETAFEASTRKSPAVSSPSSEGR